MAKDARIKVLIKGAGEHATGTAHRLFRCGYDVVMTELPVPTAVRRTVAFCTALFDDEVEVEGVRAIGYTLAEVDILDGLDGSHVPVFVDPACTLRDRWRPDVIVDGRILKHNLDNRLDQAPLVIGLGPGLVVGQDVHVVIETNRGHDLARIVTSGAAAPDTGIPGTIAGRSAQRVLRAPVSGRLEAHAAIADLLAAGDPVARVGATTVYAAIDGVLRGLTFPGAEVVAGQKIGDVDPRGDRSSCYTISDKARAISGSVLEVVTAHVHGTR